MNYDNYECNIIEKYSVVLTGWPIGGPIKNPGKLAWVDLENLLNALESEKCKWVTLDAAQLAARIADNKARHAKGEVVYKPRQRCTGLNNTQQNDILDTDSTSSGEDSE